MSIDPEIQGLAAAAGRTEGAGTDAAGRTEIDPTAGAAFRALLERIEESARALGERSDSVEDPKQLGEAVTRARESVREAVDAGNELLEAYRAAQLAADETGDQRPEPTEDPQADRRPRR